MKRVSFLYGIKDICDCFPGCSSPFHLLWCRRHSFATYYKEILFSVLPPRRHFLSFVKNFCLSPQDIFCAVANKTLAAEVNETVIVEGKIRKSDEKRIYHLRWSSRMWTLIGNVGNISHDFRTTPAVEHIFWQINLFNDIFAFLASVPSPKRKPFSWQNFRELSRKAYLIEKNYRIIHLDLQPYSFRLPV